MSGGYPVSIHQRGLSPASADLVELGKLGAVVGLCGAGAHNLWRLHREEIDAATALTDTLRVGLASGLATATAGLAASAFRPSSLLALAATLVTGTAVMYALAQTPPDPGTERQESTAPTQGDAHV
jgi:hypothetical protein